MRAILTYHSIDDSGSPISVSEDEFRRHVRFLASDAVRVVPLAELLEPASGENAVAITFDDAFVSFAETAWPPLAEAGLPVTLFAVTGRMGATNEWGGSADPGIPVLPLMDWETLGRLAEEGVEVGSHTETHPHLDRLAEEELLREIEDSRQAIRERIGELPGAFAYPYGTHDDRTVAAVSGLYRLAVTTELRAAGEGADPFRLPRLDAFYLRGEGALERFGTPAFRRRIALRRSLRDLRGRILKRRRFDGRRQVGQDDPRPAARTVEEDGGIKG